MKIFYEIHSDNPREGPGDSISTERAFSLLEMERVETDLYRRSSDFYGYVFHMHEALMGLCPGREGSPPCLQSF
jgi:hypothetical protein